MTHPPDRAPLADLVMKFSTDGAEVALMSAVLQRLTMTPPKGLEAGDLVRYKTEVELPQRQRLVTFVLTWATHSPSDFSGSDAAASLQQFLQKLQDLGLGKQSLALKQAFEAKRDELQAAPKEKSISMPSEAKPFWTVLTFSATDIAQQLTLVMAEKLRQVTAMSLSNTTEWVSETGKTVAENSPVTQLIEWTNRVNRWVASQIRSSADERRRSKVIKQFVKIVQECHKHTDLNTCWAICSALKAVVADPKELKDITSLIESLGRTQRKDHGVTPPRIPILQSALLELSEHQPMHTDAGTNSTITVLGALIQEILLSAVAPYPFPLVKPVRELITAPFTADDQWLPLLSFTRRPQRPAVASPIANMAKGTTTLTRSQSPPQVTLVDSLKQNTQLFELLLRVLHAEKDVSSDLLSDKAREAVLLLERFGGLDDDDSDASEAAETKNRNTLYSPMLSRPKSDTNAHSQPLNNAVTKTPQANVSKSQPLPSLPVVAPPPPELTRAQQWQVLLLQRGVPTTYTTRYAKLFDDEDIELTQLPHLNQKMLVALGIMDEHVSVILTAK